MANTHRTKGLNGTIDNLKCHGWDSKLGYADLLQGPLRLCLVNLESSAVNEQSCAFDFGAGASDVGDDSP